VSTIRNTHDPIPALVEAAGNGDSKDEFIRPGTARALDRGSGTAVLPRSVAQRAINWVAGWLLRRKATPRGEKARAFLVRS